MSARVEKLITNYQQMVSQKKCLAYQVAHFRGLSPEDVIASMYTAHHEGERVQTSGTSDKTAQIALNYESRMARLNREWYEHLEKELVELTDELNFFEGALRALPVNVSQIMWDLVVEGMTWDTVADVHHMSRANVGKLRKRAILELDKLYALRDSAAAAYMLN